MRLRQTIRAPSRYEDECELSTGVSPRRLPRRRKAAAEAEEERAIPYVEYNPNQPPAAFLTLDHPLPAGQNYHSLPTTTSPSAAAAANVSTGTEDADLEADEHRTDAFDSLHRGIPSEQLDNFIASNGPQNPQYKRNMALLAREDDDFDLDISDEDDEQQPSDDDTAGAQWVHHEESIPDDPQWSDISLSLQIEIAENMLETHRLSTIQILLGLSQSDIEQLTLNLHMQNADLEYENRVLEEMRNKQMEALMCLDNSDLKQHSVPARLVMARKAWNQCHRVIRKQSKMKYLLCQVGDLLLARKFLSKRGLPMIYAGEWHNQFVATPSISSSGDAAEHLEWKSTTEAQSNIPTMAGNSYHLPMNPLHSATGTQSGAQNPSPATVGEMPVVQLPLAQRYDTMPQTNTEQSSTNRNVQLVLPNQALVRLRIGPKNAARIHIDQPAMPFRRHMDTPRKFLATPQPQTREPNSDDTIEESPSQSERPDSMPRQDLMPVRRMFGSWSSTGASHLQPPGPSFPMRPRPGSFSNIIPAGRSTAKPQTRQFDQAKRISTGTHPTPHTAHSFDSSPPQPSDVSTMEGIVYENSQSLAVRHAMPTPAATSPNYTTTTNLTANDYRNPLPESNIEMCLATPESYRTTVSERQRQSSISAYQQLPIPPSDETESGKLGSEFASFSLSGVMIGPLKPKRNQRATHADLDAFPPTTAMQGLDPLNSISLNPRKTVKVQAGNVGSFVSHEAQPVNDSNHLADATSQGIANPPMTPQPPKSIKYINPLFDFDSFEIHADNQQASQDLNFSQSTHSYSSTDQGHAAAGMIDTSQGKSPPIAGMSRAAIEDPPSINAENSNQPAANDILNDQLSPISANVTADAMPLTRKTRQSARKQNTSAKRDISTDLKTSQRKRGKYTAPATSLTTNATPTPSANPPIPRGRGRPRKHPIEK